MTAGLAARAGGPAECGAIEVEYVDPGPGAGRKPVAACWSSRFEVMSPVRAVRHCRAAELAGQGAIGSRCAMTAVPATLAGRIRPRLSR